MKNFTIPDDPLLDEVAAAPSPEPDHDPFGPTADGHDTEPQAHNNGEHEPPRRHDTHESEEDINAPNAHKRPRLDNHGDQQAINDGNHGRFGLFAPPGNVATPPVRTSLRQFVPSLASSKKLRGHSEQELHRFATSSQPEREVMAFALNLEIRDSLDMISNAVTSSGVHPDLRKHIKKYSGCLFYSPTLPYYSGTRGGTRSKELQKTVLNMLKLCQIPNIPPPENHVATQGVLSLIGSDLIDYRSATKTELSKRKPGGANMDLGSFVANLTRNTNVKITKEHYGRVAFLSHEYRRWDSRDKTNPELVNVPYWDWVDKALENARKKYGNRPGKVNQYIQSIIDEDEKLFSKAIGTVASPEERENWQRQVEMASSVLPAIANN